MYTNTHKKNTASQLPSSNAGFATYFLSLNFILSAQNQPQLILKPTS